MAKVSAEALKKCIKSLGELNKTLLEDYENTVKSLKKLGDGQKDQNFQALVKAMQKPQKEIMELAKDIETKRKIVKGINDNEFTDYLKAVGKLYEL